MINSRGFGVLHRELSHILTIGTRIATSLIADARQERWGKRFRAVLAEIAKPEVRGTPSSSLWLFESSGVNQASSRCAPLVMNFYPATASLAGGASSASTAMPSR